MFLLQPYSLPPSPQKKKKTSLYPRDPKRSSSEAASFLSAPNALLLVCRRTPSDFFVPAQMIPLEKISHFDSNVHPYECFFSDATIPLQGMSKKCRSQLESLSMGECIGLQVLASNPPLELSKSRVLPQQNHPVCGDCFRFWWWGSFLWPFRERQKNPSSFGYG